MNIEETLDYLKHFPVWTPQAVLDGTMPIGLVALKALLHKLGDPQEKVSYVHIGGTNGKGSTASFLLQILTESGLSCGIFTSPYLVHFSEEIRIGNTPIPDDDLAACMTKIRAVCEELKKEQGISPTKFELECACAFLYFAQKQCDIGIMEVGLGGKQDATNVISSSLLSILTTISLDHTEILGNTLAEIAAEKAGIIKENGTVLLYPQEDEAVSVIKHICDKKQATIHTAILPDQPNSYSLKGQLFDLRGTEYSFSDLSVSLLGSYQIKNAAVAVQAAMLLKDKGFPITETAIRTGLQNTIWPGRFELIAQHPAVICDGSHNPQGAALLAESLQQYFPEQKICFVTGVLADKDYRHMLKPLLSLAKRFYTITPGSPRALSAESLTAYLSSIEQDAASFSSLEEAIDAAKKDAGETGVVCIFGSLSYLGDARNYLLSC